jgi:hypothetical protein
MLTNSVNQIVYHILWAMQRKLDFYVVNGGFGSLALEACGNFMGFGGAYINLGESDWIKGNFHAIACVGQLLR